jgi:hypothetical protein
VPAVLSAEGRTVSPGFSVVVVQVVSGRGQPSGGGATAIGLVTKRRPETGAPRRDDAAASSCFAPRGLSRVDGKADFRCQPEAGDAEDLRWANGLRAAAPAQTRLHFRMGITTMVPWLVVSREQSRAAPFRPSHHWSDSMGDRFGRVSSPEPRRRFAEDFVYVFLLSPLFVIPVGILFAVVAITPWVLLLSGPVGSRPRRFCRLLDSKSKSHMALGS